MGLAAHQRVNTASRRAQRPGPRLPVREKTRPAAGLQLHFREKLRPAPPIQWHFREKTRPAGHQTPILGCFERAGRTFSRFHDDTAPQANFFALRTPPMGTLKPMTPLQPLMQASVKPPSPMLAPEQQPLKPTTPMQPKTTPKTPNSHPHRRWRFQSRLGRRPQRRQGFQTSGPPGSRVPAASAAGINVPAAPKTRMQFDWERFQQRLETLQSQRCKFIV